MQSNKEKMTGRFFFDSALAAVVADLRASDIYARYATG